MAKTKTEPDFQKGVAFIATTEQTRDDLTSLRYAPSVCLLAHLFGRTPVSVAEAVMKMRKGDGKRAA